MASALPGCGIQPFHKETEPVLCNQVETSSTTSCQILKSSQNERPHHLLSFYQHGICPSRPERVQDEPDDEDGTNDEADAKSEHCRACRRHSPTLDPASSSTGCGPGRNPGWRRPFHRVCPDQRCIR